jgi:hypothetical protein
VAFSNRLLSTIEGTATHFKKLLIGGGIGEKMPNYIIGE